MLGRVKRYLARNWFWILLPSILFGLLYVAVILFTEEEGAAPMTYALF